MRKALTAVEKQVRDQTDVVLGVGGRQMVCGCAKDQGLAIHQRLRKVRGFGLAGKCDNNKFYAYSDSNLGPTWAVRG
jgi:hypothetical protein